MANFNTGLTKQQIITALTKALESMSEQEVQSAISTAVSGKQDILSFDNTPTSGSSNPVTSGGIYTDQQRQETEIGAVAALGAKNLFNIGAAPTVNHTDYTLTDGKLTVSANGNWAHYSVPLNLPAGNYVMSAVISGYSRASGAPDTSMRIRMSAATSGGSSIILQTVTGNGTMSVPFTWTGGTLYLQFYPNYNATSYANSFSAEDVMIRRAEITDDSYAPYAPTNRELYETKAKQTETNVIANLGAKNLLYISNTPGYTATSHGRTFTVLSDGGIKITGASSDSSNADFYVIGSWVNRSILLNENKDSCLIRMTCDTDYAYSQIRLKAMNRSTGSTVNETGVETNKDVQLSHVITAVFVSVFPSVTLPEDGIVVYPMIRRAEITDNTFVPYAPTNRDLYEMILALQSGRSVQSVSPALMQAGRLDAELTDAGRIDAELMDDTDNDVSETSGGEEMR